jgi:hypothetical protein
MHGTYNVKKEICHCHTDGYPHKWNWI